MRIILDTNVLVSGIFFGGPPFQILNAWRNRTLQLVLSPEILEEYQRVAVILGEKYTNVDLHPILDLLTINSDIVAAPPLTEVVTNDPDDEMFIACAVASQTKLIVSGDKHLLDVDGYRGIQVLKPRLFVETYLNA
ncbi:MAG: putative toxin-antitoxin system toxin component, PIN family [Pseudomonadales bacterium]